MGRGFEWLAAAEIGIVRGWQVHDVTHRSVFFAAPRAGDALGLRTVDDVYLHCGRLAGIDRTRASLSRIRTAIAELDLEAQLGDGPRQPVAHRVTASFLGRRNYNRFEIEDAVAGALESLATVAAGPELHWRVHVWDDVADLGVRVGSDPLHRRPWKSADRLGTLHPPAAAALALLGLLRPGARVLDPFCGAGTIVIEALSLEPGILACGADIDPEAVELAQANVRNAGVAARISQADAGRIALNDGRFDRVLTNLPWGEAVPAQASLTGGMHPFVARLEGMLEAPGRVVLLAAPETGIATSLERVGMAIGHLSRVRLSGRVAELVAARSGPTSTDERRREAELDGYRQRYGQPLGG